MRRILIVDDEWSMRFLLRIILENAGYEILEAHHGAAALERIERVAAGFRLMLDPVVLGGGKRIFCDDGLLRPLRLVDGRITSTGAILATFAPAA